MIQCARCGAGLRADTKWCLECGQGVDGSAEEQHSAPTLQVSLRDISLSDETLTEFTVEQFVLPPSEDSRPTTNIRLATIAEPPVATVPGDLRPPEPGIRSDTIPVFQSALPTEPGAPYEPPATSELAPPELPARPTLQQSRPEAPSPKTRTPVPAALLLVPLLVLVALAGAGAYYVVTRELAPKNRTPPVRGIARQPPVKPAPVAAQPAAIEGVTQSLETQGPPAPGIEPGLASPLPATEPGGRASSSRTARKPKKNVPAPAPEPLPEPEPAPEEPQPVDPMAVVEPGPGVTSAQVLFKAPLRLPLRARIRRIRGSAVVEVIVGVSGAPESPQVVESSGNELFDRAAMNAAMQSRFAPGLRDGERVRTRTRISFSNVSTPQETEEPPAQE